MAERVHRYLAERLKEGQPELARNLAPAPNVEAFAAIIDAAFWASLRREEGQSPRISLTYLPPPQLGVRFVFEHPLPLAPDELTRLAPAVERPGVHLGVWNMHGEWKVWGATRSLPAFCFVLEVTAPGVLVVKLSRGEETGKFLNFAVLEGDQVKMLDRGVAQELGSPSPLRLLFGLDAQPHKDSFGVFAKLAASMRAHGHGGSLLVVPPDAGKWRESVVQPIRYSVVPAFTRLAEMMRAAPEEMQEPLWQGRVQGTIDTIAGLTAVDGALIITEKYEVLAFGAKIQRRDGARQAEQVLLMEAIEGSSPRLVHVAHLGGTRHMSAAQFVQDQQDAVALVASKDGGFTALAWSEKEGMPRGYRVEALLL